MRGLIISNCQVQPLRHYLTLLCDGVEFDAIGVHLIPVEGRQDYLAAKLREMPGYDLVLTVPLSEDFHQLSGQQIDTTFPKADIFRIANIFYDGLHPDIQYLGGMSERVIGPLLDYHSRIGLAGFAAGLSVRETIDLFCDETYRALGYYDRSDLSLAELRRRDEATDIPVTVVLERMLQAQPVMMSVNHPTAALLFSYAQKIAGTLADIGVGNSGWSGPLHDFLAGSTIFPVYPEIATHHALSYKGCYRFKPMTIGDAAVHTLSLEEFISAEFETLRGVSRAELMTAHHSGLLIKTVNSLGLELERNPA